MASRTGMTGDTGMSGLMMRMNPNIDIPLVHNARPEAMRQLTPMDYGMPTPTDNATNRQMMRLFNESNRRPLGQV